MPMFKDINQETGFTSCNNKSENKKGGSFLDHLGMKTTSVAFVILQLPLNLLPRSLLFDVVIIYFVPLPTIWITLLYNGLTATDN